MGGFRTITQLDPIDTLVYSAAVYEMAELVEAARIAPERLIAFSYRICPKADGSLFANENGWTDFHEQSKRLAESTRNKQVLMADITDFYNQASQHRIENALESAQVNPEFAKSIESFLNRLAAKHSRGLPVGPTASIILAEACLNDVDTFLLRKGVKHTRYVDDFCIFCKDRNQAVTILHDLSDYLHTAHRLTLNDSKTRILTTADFLKKKELRDPEDEEKKMFELLQQQIDEMFENESYYDDTRELEEIQPRKDKELRSEFRKNLAGLFAACLDEKVIHLGVSRHLLRRARDLRTNIISRQVFDNLAKLTPVFRDVAQYIVSTKKASNAYIDDLITFLRDDAYGQLPFVRMWGVYSLLEIGDKSHAGEIRDLAEKCGSFARRLSALVAKEHKIVDWVRENKENWSNFGPWERRALIFSASALPRDERNSWLGIVQESEDLLDRVVASTLFSKR